MDLLPKLCFLLDWNRLKVAELLNCIVVFYQGKLEMMLKL